MNITGTWKGEYAIEETSEGGGKAVAGTVVGFTMELKQGWLGSVTGTIKEDDRMGFAEKGEIKGKLRGNVFTFDKLMPVFRLIHERSRLTLEQWAERYKVVMASDEPHPKIGHIGDVSPDGKSMEGTWLMKEVIMQVPGSGSALQLPKMAGTFKMNRQE